MNILAVNDDGITAPGLLALVTALARRHAVRVAAPATEQSAMGHGITFLTPLRADPAAVEGAVEAWAVSGTPADCIKLAVGNLLDTRPDLVVSGVNLGANLGMNLHYSGTVAAAREAALMGIPAMAVSLHGWDGVYFDAAARVAVDMMADFPAWDLPCGVFLNLNVPDLPADRMRGVAICRQDNQFPPDRDTYKMRMDPRRRPYYWLDAQPPLADVDPEHDVGAMAADMVTVTPLTCDMTHYESLRILREQMPAVSARYGGGMAPPAGSGPRSGGRSDAARADGTKEEAA